MYFVKNTLWTLKKFFIGFGKGLFAVGGFVVLALLFLMFVGFIATYVGNAMSIVIGLTLLIAILTGLANV